MAWSRRTTSAPLLEPKRNLDLLGGPNLWTRTERAGVRSVFNDARASSLCLAPWDTRKSLNIFESLEIQQLQMIWNLPLDLEAILKVACRARRAKRLVSSWVPTPGAQLAAFRRIPRADAFRQKKHDSRKLEPARNETSIFIIFGISSQWISDLIQKSRMMERIRLSTERDHWKLNRSDIILHHITVYRVTSCHVVSRHATSCHIVSRHATSCHVMPRHCCSRFARSNSRTRESSRHGDSDWTTSGVDRCYSGNVGRLLDPGEPWSMPRFTRLR